MKKFIKYLANISGVTTDIERERAKTNNNNTP